MKIPYVKTTSLVYLLFFFSGTCGFVYDIVWMHDVGIATENTVFAQVAVLALFVSGIALGALVFGSFADRLPNPLRVFSIIAFLISVIAFLSPWVIEFTAPVSKLLYIDYHSSFHLANVVRFFVCGAVLFLPAGLLGASLPVLMTYHVRNTRRIGYISGQLYGLGGLGVATGTLLSGFFLLPSFGYRLTLDIAVAVNILVAIGAYAISVKGEKGVLEKVKEKRLMLRGKKATVLSALLFTAFCGAIYQVALTRTLVQVFDSTMYFYTPILGFFVFAISLGCLSLPVLKKIGKDRFLFFSMNQFLLGISMLFSTVLLGWLPVFAVKIAISLAGSSSVYMFFQLALISVVFLVPAFLIGVVFAIAGRIYMGDLNRAGQEMGAVFITNVTGVVLGLFIGVFVLFPALGIRDTILTAAFINMGLGVALMYYTNLVKLPRYAVALVAIIILPPLFVLVPRWDNDIMASGAYVQAGDYGAGGAESELILNEMKRKSSVIYYKEAALYTVSVTKSEEGRLSLKIDGNVEATDSREDLAVQRLLADIALLLHKDPKQILLIGLGSGAPLQAVTSHSVERIDCVEVSEEVVEAARFFRAVNEEAILDWRVKLVAVDGRAHLELSENKYDVIISSTSRPWVYRSGGYFTREYFNAARKRLSDGGIMVQWVKADRLSVKDFKVIIRTFLEAFPFAALWEINRTEGDYLLMGSMNRLLLDYKTMKEHFEKQSVINSLEKTGISNLSTLLNFYAMDAGAMKVYSWEAGINTDDNTSLVFSRNKAGSLKARATHLDYDIDNHRVPPFLFLQNVEEEEFPLISNTYLAGSYIRSAEDLFISGNTDEALIQLDLAMLLVPDNTDISRFAARIYLEAGKKSQANDTEGAAGFFKKAVELDPEDSEAWYLLGIAYFTEGRVDEAIEVLKHSSSLEPTSPRIHLALASAYNIWHSPRHTK
jgi:spermidine synthase